MREQPTRASEKHATIEEVAAVAGDRGYWVTYLSPFTKGERHLLAFTPHGVIGLNGGPDVRVVGSDLQVVLDRALYVAHKIVEGQGKFRFDMDGEGDSE